MKPYRTLQIIKMDNQQILEKPKLSFSSSLREASKILSHHPNFISLILFLSFPIFASLLAFHILLHPTFIQLLKLLSRQNPFDSHIYSVHCFGDATDCFLQSPSFTDELKATVSQRFLISALLLSALVFFLDLLTTIATVSISAALYGGNPKMGFKGMLIQTRRVGLKAPLATSLCALLLASLTLLGLVSLSTNIYLTLKPNNYYRPLDIGYFFEVIPFGLIFGSPVVVLLAKFVEWSAVWNMGIVVSILDKNQGHIAIGVAEYLSRGSCRKLGFRLMGFFFVLKVALGLPCLYALWNEGSCGVWGNVVSVSLNCVGNVVMWVVLMVYFYDCKREFLEKKIDVENNGKAVESLQQ